MLYRLFVTVFVVFYLTELASAQSPTAADADFDGNGVVDVADFLAFVGAFGSRSGDSAYQAKLDLDGDGVIGIPDFLFFVANFGKTVKQTPGAGNSDSIPNDVGKNINLEEKRKIAEFLFNSKPAYYDYNNFGNCPKVSPISGNCDRNNGYSGYRGGHAGWDVQTESVAGTGDNNTADEPFYSLTPGKVIATGGPFGKIAVYYEGKTILYLHARRIDVTEGQTIGVGTRLGIQGNVGLSSDPDENEHVHIEVREGSTSSSAFGADYPNNPYPNIDPVVYLYSVLEKHSVD